MTTKTTTPADSMPDYTLEHFRADNRIAAKIGDEGDNKRDQSEGYFARNIMVAAGAGILKVEGRSISSDMLANLGGMIAGAKNAEKDNDYLSEVRTAVSRAGIVNPNDGIKPGEMTDTMRKAEKDYRAALQKFRRSFDSACLLAYANVSVGHFIATKNGGFWQIPAHQLCAKGEKISDAKYGNDSIVKLDNGDSMLVSYRTKNNQPANKVVRFSFAALKAAIIENRSGAGKGGMSIDRALTFIGKNVKADQYTGIAANEHLRPLVETALLVLTGIKREIDKLPKAETKADDKPTKAA